MRPEDFSPGNLERRRHERRGTQASMRPEDFSPGNADVCQRVQSAALHSFNEAGGFLPRKRLDTAARARATSELQ